MTLSVEERLAKLEVQMETKCSTLEELGKKLDAIHEELIVSRAEAAQRARALGFLLKISAVVIPLMLWSFGGAWRQIAEFFKGL